jgi:mono/diheme cytochrome c family protein
MIAGLFATIVVPGLRNANKPKTPTPVNAVIGQPGWLNPAEYPPARGKLIPAVDPQSLIQPSPELTARGKELFALNCVQCHGPSGRGDGPGATNMNPAPRDFTNPQGWTHGLDMPAIYKTLTEGIVGSSMAAFDYLSRKDRMALVHYVQSLGSFSHSAGSSEAMAALSKELARPGEQTPNKIPVSMAMDKLASEYRAPALFTLAADDSSTEAQLLRRLIVDGNRAARTLAGSNSWHSGAGAMALTLISGAPGNGFSQDVATLSSAEWKIFYSAILKRLGKMPEIH